MIKILVVLLGFISSASFAENIVYETEWVDDTEMSSTLREMNTNRLFPCQVQGKVEGIKIRYKASYCPFLPDMNFFYSRWGLSDSWYTQWSEYYKAIGMVEHVHTTFIDLSGSTVHQATWILIGEFKTQTEADGDGESAKEQ